MELPNKPFILSAVLLIFTILFFTGCPGTTDATLDELETTSTNEELLESLGLTIDDSDAVNGDGETITGTMNPLGGVITTLDSIYEIAQIGADITELGGPYSLSDHSQEANSSFSIKTEFDGGDSDWMNLPKKSVAADIDEDGVDNVITAVFNGDADQINLRVQMADGSIEQYYIQDEDGADLTSFAFMDGFEDYTWLNNRFFMRDFTCGDYDGDHETEFAVSCMTGILIFDYDSDDDEFNRIGSLSLDYVGDSDAGYFPYVRVESGDLNDDGCDELVVVNGGLKITGEEDTGKLYILEGVEDDGLGIEDADLDIENYCTFSSNLSDNTDDVTFASAELVLFDSDYDGCMEIALAGIQNNAGGDLDAFLWYCYYNLYLRYINPYNITSENWQYSSKDPDGNTVSDYYIGQTDSNGGVHPRNIAVPRMAAGRFDSEEREMVNVMDLMMYLDDGEWVDYEEFIYTEENNSTYAYNDMLLDTVVAGDVTGNGLDELIYMTWSDLPYGGNDSNNGNNTMNSINIWGQDDNGSYGLLETLDCNSSNAYPTLALANVDEDSIVLEYITHELVYSAPQVLAVIASAPYWKELVDEDEMDISNSSTSYAESETDGAGSAVNWGFNVSVSVGISVDDPITDSGIEAEITVDNSWDWSWGQMYTRSTTIEYAVDAGSDQVVFAGVPYDAYIYEVLAYDGDQDADIGDYITINVPREFETNSVSVDFYNSIVDEEYQITDEVLTHTIGEPDTYYDEDEKDDFAENDDLLDDTWLFSSTSATVPEGTALNTITTGKEVESTYEFGYTLAGSYGGQVKIAFVTAGMEYGVYAGYNYTYSVGNGVEISGSVGPIEDESIWTNYNFEWGMMMIPRTIGNEDDGTEQEFHYVTYWVED